MTEVHEVLYPPTENDTCVLHRRYDGKERLIAWSLRQGEHYLLFRVASFREVALPNGAALDVPETIECRFSEADIDPEAAFAEATSERGAFTWTGREYEAELALQYNHARCFDPSIGRWLPKDPLGYEKSEDNKFPYPGDAS